MCCRVPALKLMGREDLARRCVSGRVGGPGTLRVRIRVRWLGIHHQATYTVVMIGEESRIGTIEDKVTWLQGAKGPVAWVPGP